MTGDKLNSEKLLAIDAFKLLNEMVGNLSVASRFPEFSRHEIFKDSPTVARIMTKFSDMIMVITLVNFLEWDKILSKLLTNDGRKEARLLAKDIDRKKLKPLRDKIVAHVIDRKTKAPLTYDEKENLFRESGFESVDSFCAWVKSRCTPTLESVKTSILQKYSLEESEIFRQEKEGMNK